MNPSHSRDKLSIIVRDGGDNKLTYEELLDQG
ncbi:hypothetical protein RO3G_14556 [Rhizopus delemar RA 99-880]|uniref:Uncharacterized protein n=1 Tax=Rhizopus delemar (strain RA 99-880 / ATCC MYA-4621 / FGSC 9543 / NRRL 43880) TaxID=246409 RepID=I1CN15_RHIO9|nr:hypothetical protein RO3G_14556 [Rhizopus delemar RA 99-880]|eukprot:EIE89845.1 hypothetical protein RO3G_14556 [Rhizopus delemar RA 99-880]